MTFEIKIKKIICTLLAIGIFSPGITLASLADYMHAPDVVTMETFDQPLVGFVQKTINALRYTSYKLGGAYFDLARGVYIGDCSSYVDYILQSVCPKAYGSLVTSTGTDKPSTHDYYNFFTRLNNSPKRYWDKVEVVNQLQPGDILVFRGKHANVRRTNGHVMIVMKKPVKLSNSFYIQVADSAPSGHTQDTRAHHTSGIGVGTLLLKTNPKTGKPSAYAWKVGSHWENKVNFAMARPADKHLS